MKKPSKVKSKSARRVSSGDIANLILADHKPIKSFLAVLKASDVGLAKKRTAYAKFQDVLSRHAKAEEQSLYIHLKQLEDLRTEGFEGDTEHAVADQLMRDISKSEGDDDVWMAKVKVLAEIVDHHVKEEEKEVLKQVRKAFSREERIEIGDMYSRLLSEHKEDFGRSRIYSSKDNIRAEYV